MKELIADKIWECLTKDPAQLVTILFAIAAGAGFLTILIAGNHPSNAEEDIALYADMLIPLSNKVYLTGFITNLVLIFIMLKYSKNKPYMSDLKAWILISFVGYGGINLAPMLTFIVACIFYLIINSVNLISTSLEFVATKAIKSIRKQEPR